MKVVLVSDTKGNADEGMKVVAKNLGNRLRALNHDVDLKSLADLIGFNKNVSYDIIQFLGGPTKRTIFGALLLRFWVGFKPHMIISFIHPKWRLSSKLLSFLLINTSCVVETATWDKKVSPWFKRRLICALGGVDVDKFSRVNESVKIELRKKLDLPTDCQIVLHVGHLNAGRNLSSLKCIASDSQYFVLIIGSSTVSPDEHLLRDLENNGIHIRTGYIPKIEEYYQASDYYVFPTVDEQFAIQLPLSVLEALSCGLKVVSTEFGSLVYFLKGKNLPIYFAKSDNNFLEMIQQLSENNTNMLFEDISFLSWDRMASNHDAFYKILNHA